MDLRQLAYFVRIVELKSFTRAAEQLRVAQPALGFQVRKLEEELQTQLLVRHSRGVEPTEAGWLLLERARHLLQEAALTKTALRGHSGPPRGRVTLGIAPSFGHEFATTLMLRCLQELPEVSLNLAQNLGPTIVEWLHAGRIELACLGPIDDDRLVTERLFTHDLFLVEAARGTDTPSQPIAFCEAVTQPLILPATHAGLRARLEALATAAGVSLQVACEVQSDILALELVQQSVGATVSTLTAVRQEVEQGRLVARIITEPVIPISAVLTYTDKRALSQAALAVRSLVRRVVEEQSSHMAGIWRLD